MSVDPPALARFADFFEASDTEVANMLSRLSGIQRLIDTSLGHDDVSEQIRTVNPQLADARRSLEAYQDANRGAETGIRQASVDYEVLDRKIREDLQQPPRPAKH
jgi:hypothetical protein